MTSAGLVLVVDDDGDSRTLLDLALSAEGFQVVTAVNGREGLAVARTRRPDIILLDLAMPVMDGFTFRAEQLRDDGLAPIPVICVSGRHDAATAARRLHMPHCLPKPFDLSAVIAHVRDVLGDEPSSV